VKLNSALNGCQSGSAILVQSANGVNSVVAIEESSNPRLTEKWNHRERSWHPGTIEGNVVTGLGPTTGATQNGIQIGFGAAAASGKHRGESHLVTLRFLEACDLSRMTF